MSEQEVNPNIPVFKKNAQVPLTFGTSFITRVQELLVYLTNQHTPEEIEEFNKLAKEQKELTGWMRQHATVCLLLAAIENAASANGQLTEAPATSILKSN